MFPRPSTFFIKEAGATINFVGIHRQSTVDWTGYMQEAEVSSPSIASVDGDAGLVFYQSWVVGPPLTVI